MPRYYRRRYTRVVKPKKKWASNITTYSNSLLTKDSAGGYHYTVLVQNTQQTANPTPTVIKAGNFKVSLDTLLDYGSGSSGSGNYVGQYFIIYVPEGWALNNLSGIVAAHPEWVLASKTVGSSYTTSTGLSLETLNLSTRLKRNLNSGDGIVLLLVPNIITSNATLKVSGHVRFWTCAN